MNLNNYLKEKDHITIPYSCAPSEFYTITFEGWRQFTLQIDDTNLIEMMHMAALSLDYFIKMYKDERVFTEPQIYLKPNGTFIVKIGTLEKDEYERRNVTPLYSTITTLKE